MTPKNCLSHTAASGVTASEEALLLILCSIRVAKYSVRGLNSQLATSSAPTGALRLSKECNHLRNQTKSRTQLRYKKYQYRMQRASRSIRMAVPSQLYEDCSMTYTIALKPIS